MSARLFQFRLSSLLTATTSCGVVVALLRDVVIAEDITSTKLEGALLAGFLVWSFIGCVLGIPLLGGFNTPVRRFVHYIVWPGLGVAIGAWILQGSFLLGDLLLSSIVVVLTWEFLIQRMEAQNGPKQKPAIDSGSPAENS